MAKINQQRKKKYISKCRHWASLDRALAFNRLLCLHDKIVENFDATQSVPEHITGWQPVHKSGIYSLFFILCTDAFA